MATYRQAAEGMARGELWTRESKVTGKTYTFAIRSALLLERYDGKYPELQVKRGYMVVPGLDGIWIPVGKPTNRDADDSWEPEK